MDQNDKNNQKSKTSTWVTLCVLLLTLILIAGAIYLHFFRYTLVGKSLDLGNTTSAALLLSPELALSLAKFF